MRVARSAREKSIPSWWHSREDGCGGAFGGGLVGWKLGEPGEVPLCRGYYAGCVVHGVTPFRGAPLGRPPPSPDSRGSIEFQGDEGAEAPRILGDP